MKTEVMKIQSIDGNLELVLLPASIELRFSPQAARAFDEACEAEKSATWLPVWRQIKGALISASQAVAHKFADRLRSIPLETVTDLNFNEGRLEILTSDGNQLKGHYKIDVGSFSLEYDLETPGIFQEAEVQVFIKHFREVKPLYAEYLAKLQQVKQ